MPAQSVDPRIDEGRNQPAVEEDAHHDAREEGEHEIDIAHRAAAAVTARAYPVGGTVRTVWIGPARCHAQKRRAAAGG